MMEAVRFTTFLLLALAACIDPDLVPCGDVSCPARSVCVSAGRCVATDQLDACAGLAEGDACTIDNTAGRCSAGACTISICGNGILDPGEVCDDGNTISGDGCSGNCLSNETCGNGIVDVADGEGCDCGTLGNVSAACSLPNSDDPEAECTLDCHPRFCGDGVVDLSEQCDGSVPATVSCGDFGYYSGELSCSAICQLDPSTCSGKCGDGIVQADHGEYCDGSAPAGSSCLGFGYDLGVLGCGLACGPDVRACGKLAYTEVSARNDDVVEMRGAGGVLGVVYASGTTGVVLGDASWVAATASYTAISMTPTTAWAASSTLVAQWTPTTGWVETAAPWPNGDTIVDVWASDTLGVFVSVAGSATLWQRSTAGTWTQVSGAWGAGPSFGDTHTNLWVLSSPAQVWNGTTWTADTLSGITTIVEDGTHGLWANATSGSYTNGTIIDTLGKHSPGWNAYTGSNGSVVAAAPDGAYFYASQCSIAGCTFTLTDHGLHEFASDATNGELWQTDGLGRLYESQVGGTLVAMRYGLWVEDTSQTGFGWVAAAAPGAKLVVTSAADGTLALDPGKAWLSINEGKPCTVAQVSATGSLYCGDASAGRLYDDDDSGANPIDPEVLWIAGSDVATGGSDSFAWRTSGTWHKTKPTMTITALAGDTIDDLYAIATTDGESGARLWHFDGATWTSKTAIVGATGHVVVTPTTVYLIGTNGLLAFTRATGALATIATPEPLFAIAGTVGEELWGLSSTVPFGGSPLWELTGSVWVPVNIPAGIPTLDLIGFGRDVVIVSHDGPATTSDTAFYRLARTGPW